MPSLTAADMASRTMAGKKPKRWMQKATEGAHGQFRAKAERAGESTKTFAEEHKGSPGKLGKQARLALTLMSHGGRSERRKKIYDHPRSRSND